MDWLGLRGRCVIIAGAGGIGAACASGFAAAGAKVLVLDRDQDRLAALDDDPTFRQGGGVTRQVDLSERGVSQQAVDDAAEHLGGLDVALHCIGMNDRRPVLEIDEDAWLKVIDTNLATGFSFARAAGRHMVDQGSGRVLVLSSVSGLLAHELHAPYAASKGGLNQMMRVMAREWASSGVTVNAIAPGYIETSLTAGYLAKPGIRENLTGLVPAGRLGVAEEVVGPVLFLSSPHASFVTGHVLYVDGGRTLV